MFSHMHMQSFVAISPLKEPLWRREYNDDDYDDDDNDDDDDDDDDDDVDDDDDDDRPIWIIRSLSRFWYLAFWFVYISNPYFWNFLWPSSFKCSLYSDYSSKYLPIIWSDKLMRICQYISSSAAALSNDDRHSWVACYRFQHCVDCVWTSFHDQEHHRDAVRLVIGRRFLRIPIF